MPGFDSYFIVALVASFFTAAFVGLLLERGVIRFLYKRPLESLLATWGVSLVLQQIFRHTFGAANVQVDSPSWLSGGYCINDISFAYNRLFIIGFALLIVFGTYLLLTRTSLGLQIRAVMQNRPMASCMGVRTDRVNMMTFMFGSGLAGMAGACMSQITNVGPSLGQSYIVDCFMIVVLGGVGKPRRHLDGFAGCRRYQPDSRTLAGRGAGKDHDSRRHYSVPAMASEGNFCHPQSKPRRLNSFMIYDLRFTIGAASKKLHVLI